MAKSIKLAFVWIAVLLGGITLVAPLASQSESRLVVQTEAGTPVVGVGIWISTAEEPSDSTRAGLAALSARSIFAPIRQRLDRQGGHLEMDVRPDGVLFTLLAAPDHWELAMRELGLALFRDPPLDDVVLRERERLISEVRSGNPNPAVQATRATDRILYGGNHPWAYPPLGLPETLSRFTADDVDTFLREVFRPERTLFAVVGPVVDEDVMEALSPYLSRSPSPRPERPESPAPGVYEVEYPTITTWVTLVWTLAPDSDLPAIEILAGAVGDAIAFGPRSRSVYNARSWVVRRPGRAELRVEVVVPPGEAGLWTDRVRQVVEDHAGRQITPGEAARMMRRQSGRIALSMARPEDRARAALERLLMPDEPDRDGSMTPARLRDAAASLTDPLVVQLGPFRSAIGED